MSENEGGPNWNRLPHDPAGFFDLAAQYDRRVLRQRYNQLIRIYKPEQRPDEFQKIRTAFEVLDQRLRYGVGFEPLAQHQPESQWAVVADESTSADEDGKDDVDGATVPAGQRLAARLKERIQREPPLRVYRELEARAEKNPFDYYALAVLSDVAGGIDGRQFERWLMEGVSKHRQDVALIRLLHCYVRGPIEPAAIPQLLLGCSRAVREDWFFPLTEPLWDALLADNNFDVFRDTLARCETNLRGISIDGRIAFYIQLLKSAMWTADEAWIQEKLGFVETHFERIPRHLDYEVELLTSLRAYLSRRKEFAESHSLRRRLDGALYDYFTKDQTSGDRSIIESQLEIVDDTDALAAAFAQFDDALNQAFYLLWWWVSNDVAARTGSPRAEPSGRTDWHHRVYGLLEKTAAEMKASRWIWYWQSSVLVYRACQVACVIAPALVAFGIAFVVEDRYFASRFQRYNDWVIPLAMVFGAGGAAFGYWSRKKMKTRYWFPYCRRFFEKCYRRMWQATLLRFLADTHVPYPALVSNIGELAGVRPNYSTWIKVFVDKDYVLPIYALALLFLI